MAFRVYCDEELIYDLTVPNLYLISPKLSLSDNGSGSFEFTIPPGHPQYNAIKRLTSTLKVYDDSDLIFEGRIISEKTDFYKQRICTCEGCLAYFNDTYQPLKEYSGVTLYSFIESVLEIHNNNVGENRRIFIGAISVHAPNNSFSTVTNFETTMECLKKNLVDSKLGGHLRIRWENGLRYLDYLDDFPNTSNQKIEFGKNLLDYAGDYDLSNLATVIIPRGAKLEDSPVENADAYTLVDSVNGGSIYVQSTSAVNAYGWIEQVVDWEDETSPSALLSKARTYLADTQFEELVLEIKAADLHRINPEIDKFRLLDYVRVVSAPHGMDRNIAITAIEMPLDQPDQITYTMGTKVDMSFTARSKSVNARIMDHIANIPTKHSVLKAAKANATALIHSALNGHVVITDNADELLIMDTDNKDTAKKVWRWNLNGLGYSKTGYDGEYGLAMTMDGAIVADYITTGSLDADIIRTGKIQDQTGKNFWDMDTGEFALASTATVGGKTVSKIASDAVEEQTQSDIFNKLTNNGQTQGIYLSNGKVYINATYIATGTLTDVGNNTSFDLSTGTLTMKKGSIDIGNGTFKVDTSGNLTATSASLKGSITSGESSGSKISISNGVIRGYWNDDEVGTIHMTSTFQGTATGSGMIISSDYIGFDGSLLIKGPNESVYYKAGNGSRQVMSEVNTDGKGNVTSRSWFTLTVREGLVTTNLT